MMKIVAFTGAGISKQSNIPTFMERPDVREKLFRNYANNHHEEYNEVIKQLHKQAGSDALELHGGLPEEDELSIAWSLFNKPVLYGDPAPNYQKAYEMVGALKKNDIFIVIGCSYHTAIACDLREVAKSRGAKIIEIQEDAAHNVRKVLKGLLK